MCTFGSSNIVHESGKGPSRAAAPRVLCGVDAVHPALLGWTEGRTFSYSHRPGTMGDGSFLGTMRRSSVKISHSMSCICSGVLRTHVDRLHARGSRAIRGDMRRCCRRMLCSCFADHRFWRIATPHERSCVCDGNRPGIIPAGMPSAGLRSC